MNYFKHLIVLCAFGWISGAIASPAQDAAAGSEELGRYVGAVSADKAIVHQLLDYCTSEFPDKREDIEKARAQWDARNMMFVNSISGVATRWFESAGVP